MRKPTKVKIGRSQIANGGNGLFANVDIKKGAIIARYGFDHNYISAKALDDKCEQNDMVNYSDCFGSYIFCHGEHCWDGRDPESTIARYANDAHGTSFIPNAEFKMKSVTKKGVTAVSVTTVPYMVASIDIPAGSEVFCDYGEQYWA